jgi:hypothetical protein
LIWETTKIMMLVEEANNNGETSIELGSSRDARRFRSAVYNRFQTFGVPCPIIVSVNDRTVTLRKR